jgi:putative aminopeptidase FrvX
MRQRAATTYLLIILAALSFRTCQAQKIEFKEIGRASVERWLGEAPAKDAQRKEELWSYFEAAGCQAGLSEQPVKHQRLPNILCKLPGSSNSAVLVGAHFDHVGIGQGIADNWSGAVLLPLLYESLSNLPRKHTFVFVAFTAEEQGLIGSQYYAKQMSAEEVARTRAMVNLDTLGLSPTKVWVSRADKRLFELLIRVAASRKLPLEGVNVEQVGSADSESFARLKIPRIAIHSVTQETLPILHSSRDKLAALNLSDYYDTYRLVAAYLAYLDQVLE